MTALYNVPPKTDQANFGDVKGWIHVDDESDDNKTEENTLPNLFLELAQLTG